MKCRAGIVLVTVSILMACTDHKKKNSGQSQNQTQECSVSGHACTVLQDDTSLKLEDGFAEGSATLLFDDALPESSKLKLKFVLNEGGFLNLILHSNDELSTGVRIEFKKNGHKLYANSFHAEDALNEKPVLIADGTPAEFVVTAGVVVDQSSAFLEIANQIGEVVFKTKLKKALNSDRRWGVQLYEAKLHQINSVLHAAASGPVKPNDTGDTAENDDPEVPSNFSVEHLHETSLKALKRFERMNIPNSEFIRYKTWKTPTYTWVRLSYKIFAEGGASFEQKELYLACHFHGNMLGCHTKTEAGPGEPE